MTVLDHGYLPYTCCYDRRKCLMRWIMQHASNSSYIYNPVRAMGWELNMHIFPNSLIGFQHRKGPKRGSQGSTQIPTISVFLLFYTPSFCSLQPAATDRFTTFCFFPVLFFCASSKWSLMAPYFWSSSLSLAAFVSTPPSFHEWSSHRFPHSS